MEGEAEGNIISNYFDMDNLIIFFIFLVWEDLFYALKIVDCVIYFPYFPEYLILQLRG